MAAVVTVTLGLVLAYARRVAPNAFVGTVVRAAGLGYAMPGTVLALGLLIPLAAFDNRIDAMLRSLFGISSGLLLSGTLFAIVLAYTIRFLAVSLGALEAGFERLSPNLDAAARTLGETALSALWRVHMPLLLPALGAAALLVFVDGMKELPATLLLRPFNFETLATHVYSYAALEQFEQAALGALTIVVIGLVPVLMLHNAVAGGRAGTWGRWPRAHTPARAVRFRCVAAAERRAYRTVGAGASVAGFASTAATLVGSICAAADVDACAAGAGCAAVDCASLESFMASARAISSA